MKTLGERIVFLREELDLTQKQLAAMIHITPTTLSRYENNHFEPNAEILARLSEALETTTDFLVGRSDIYKRPVTNTISTMQLSAQEQRFMNFYRSLNEENRIRLEERVRTLLDTQK